MQRLFIVSVEFPQMVLRGYFQNMVKSLENDSSLVFCNKRFSILILSIINEVIFSCNVNLFVNFKQYNYFYLEKSIVFSLNLFLCGNIDSDIIFINASHVVIEDQQKERKVHSNGLFRTVPFKANLYIHICIIFVRKFFL